MDENVILCGIICGVLIMGGIVESVKLSLRRMLRVIVIDVK